jgi:hypothetical protein
LPHFFPSPGLPCCCFASPNAGAAGDVVIERLAKTGVAGAGGKLGVLVNEEGLVDTVIADAAAFAACAAFENLLTKGSLSHSCASAPCTACEARSKATSTTQLLILCFLRTILSACW